jgi:hypothetical protein
MLKVLAHFLHILKFFEIQEFTDEPLKFQWSLTVGHGLSMPILPQKNRHKSFISILSPNFSSGSKFSAKSSQLFVQFPSIYYPPPVPIAHWRLLGSPFITETGTLPHYGLFRMKAMLMTTKSNQVFYEAHDKENVKS